MKASDAAGDNISVHKRIQEDSMPQIRTMHCIAKMSNSHVDDHLNISVRVYCSKAYYSVCNFPVGLASQCERLPPRKHALV